MIKYLRNKFQNRSKQQYGWFGRYSSWQEARAVTDGYEKDNILEKTKSALLKIRSGDAIYERDSVLFDKKEYPFPLITFLQHSALEKGAPLNVLDFGGSLGSSYFQVKEFLNDRVCDTWNVVEQPHYVDCGKRYFEDEQLRFFNTIEDCAAVKNVDLVVLSGVVQYLDKPHEFLGKLASMNFPYIIFDRTAFIHEEGDRLTIQRVWPSVYEASYPSWFFNEAEFLAHFRDTYDKRAEFSTYVEGESIIEIDQEPLGYDKGFYLVKKA
ncbi:MAG: TIGR04325 family methyltransferase [Arcticibacter sp.]